MAEAWGTGRCACSLVRYELASAPYWTHCCHCTECQRLTGSAFAVNTMIEAERVHVTGKTAEVTVETPSGGGQTINNCASCQTALWTCYGGNPAIRFVRGGTLDQAGQIVPDIHIFTRSKQPWVVIPEGTRTEDGFYNYEDVWPAEALARRTAANATHGG
ncbi:MAG: GFA family protein [Paracoccaceae bacterium]